MQKPRSALSDQNISGTVILGRIPDGLGLNDPSRSVRIARTAERL